MNKSMLEEIHINNHLVCFKGAERIGFIYF